jgi:aryl-alcohol dehydrogenase-like predicted oxidoreductase
LTGIRGFATAAETRAYAARIGTVQNAVLGRTGLRCSQAGFGAYRIGDDVDRHKRALFKALSGGINLIDTSANYADGGSEILVGMVLAEMIGDGSLAREEVITVTKAGYLQGRNYALSRERAARGQPFPDLVPYAEGLEHCIHPEFLEDQLTRSLERLNLATVDFFLLHNPEYYLTWASRQDLAEKERRAEYDRRIRQAFRHLEQEVERGRIQYYGISSNTFPVSSAREDFTCLQRILELANTSRRDHHFALVQFPMNLVESGAVLQANQPDGATLLDTARRAGLATLVNRPLNAIGPHGLMRLAEVESLPPLSDEDVIQTIQRLKASETQLIEDILPTVGIAPALASPIKTQVRIGTALLRAYREFSSYDQWCQVRDAQLYPRVAAVLDYFNRRDPDDALRHWAEAHKALLTTALEAVTAYYVPEAAQRAHAVKEAVQSADENWAGDGTLSQLAIRALRTTDGVSSVLVGMRRSGYVRDVLQELQRGMAVRSREREWAVMRDNLEMLDSTAVE